ncbi:hypothetical protein QC762_401940 [Podospora pseudocomata]|uniref:FAD-binding PCMH-type domain-containing protein n=3 Tax=Podospora TaxID=5144 RepID=A0ABR0HC35_9PEZI|nr:hypothetical protein QC762_401940 [Podospora pseudocomata]KAK4665459.1 hypothetical protein QC763_401940 [Podospora pseudopauciseta]KAK4676610.1 hypothetical protein QC764_401940 [Podospora pseudoanserina]
MQSLVASLVAVASLISVVKGDTCSELRANTNIEVSAPISPTYIAEQTEYWSASCSALKPSCIIFPKSAAEVSTIISVLNTNDEHFAVKSGGHSPNNYYASVDGGPLISTQNLDHANLDPATGILDFGPGNRLDGLAQKLQGTGWTFVGGRIGNTGTGGLMLGGGLSYMSAQHGWSASSVLEYELVLPNGTITYPSATNHPSLFKALKGGGNNFGIVTNYKTQAYPQGNVWGGNLLFLRTPATDKKILQAVRDFTEYNTDDRAAVIVTAERAQVNLVDSWILFLFYDGPTPPAGTFTNFTSIGPIANTARTRTYADLMTFSNWVVLKGFQVQIGTETIPLPSTTHSVEVLEGIHAHWRNISLTTLAVPGIVASIAYQPFPKRIAAAAREKSPDLIDADPDADKLIIEMNYAFLNPLDYPLMDGKMQETYTGIRERVLSWQAEGKLPDNVDLPVFMNYGFYRQDYFGRLKPENRALAREVAEEVDPEGLFRNRTGGWKP